MDKDQKALQAKIGVHFKNMDLLREALTHRSYLNERSGWKLPHNERLEYLGDAVLELAVSETLFAKFSDYPEGKLTMLRAALVNYQMLSAVASEMGLEKSILMSKGEARDKGKAREVILANAIEALIGAVYLDRGFEEVRGLINKFIMPHLAEVLEKKTYRDAKSELQELYQDKLKLTPTYSVLGESGPAHNRTFKVGVYLADKLVGEGSGNSKQEAELEAAKAALERARSGR